MTYYDEKLKALQEKISRSRQLTSMLNELRIQRDTIAARVRELETIKMDEQADVLIQICSMLIITSVRMRSFSLLPAMLPIL